MSQLKDIEGTHNVICKRCDQNQGSKRKIPTPPDSPRKRIKSPEPTGSTIMTYAQITKKQGQITQTKNNNEGKSQMTIHTR